MIKRAWQSFLLFIPAPSSLRAPINNQSPIGPPLAEFFTHLPVKAIPIIPCISYRSPRTTSFFVPRKEKREREKEKIRNKHGRVFICTAEIRGNKRKSREGEGGGKGTRADRGWNFNLFDIPTESWYDTMGPKLLSVWVQLRLEKLLLPMTSYPRRGVQYAAYLSSPFFRMRFFIRFYIIFKSRDLCKCI